LPTERQKSEQTEKELKLKTEALDYLNAEKERIEQLAEETREKKRTLSIRLEQLLKGIEDIFRLDLKRFPLIIFKLTIVLQTIGL